MRPNRSTVRRESRERSAARSMCFPSLLLFGKRQNGRVRLRDIGMAFAFRTKGRSTRPGAKRDRWTANPDLLKTMNDGAVDDAAL